LKQQACQLISKEMNSEVINAENETNIINPATVMMPRSHSGILGGKTIQSMFMDSN